MAAIISFRIGVDRLVQHTVSQLIVLSIFITLTIYADNQAYFFAAGYVLLALWASRWNWSRFGMVKPDRWSKVWLQAVGLAALLFIVGDVILFPLIEKWTAVPIDISALDPVRGNLVSYLLLIGLMWIVAGFGEELIYRGFLIERIGKVFGGSNAAHMILILMSAVLFGLAHSYQGPSGMITTGLIGLVFGIVFITYRNRLWLTILTHGTYDVIGITLIYLDLDPVLYSMPL